MILLALLSTANAGIAFLFDNFDDGDTSEWNIVDTNVTTWSLTESADPGSTLLEVETLAASTPATWGGVRLQQDVSPSGLFEAELLVSWDGTGSLGRADIALLDRDGAVIVSMGYRDQHGSDAQGASWYAVDEGGAANGGANSLPLVGMAVFQLTRGPSGTVDFGVNGVVVHTGAAAGHVRTVEIRLEAFEGWPHANQQIDLVLFTGAEVFDMDGPLAPAAGGSNTFQFYNGTPGGQVGVVVSPNPGSSPVPPCPGTTLGIAAPIFLGLHPLAADGSGSLTLNFPPTVAGRTGYFQAVDVSSCTGSEVVTVNVP